jgi:rubrerythrin
MERAKLWHCLCSNLLLSGLNKFISTGEKETYMSIGMQRFASEGRFATYDPFARETDRVGIFQLQCRCCGYEPEDVVVPPRVCPKCHGEAWERFARPGSILTNANRY